MFTVLHNSVMIRRLVVIGILVAWCSCLVVVRIRWTGSHHYRFLIWNLCLAGLPLGFSSALGMLNRRRSSRLFQLTCLGMWLIFLPNSPYILTDLVHLTAPSTAPAWFDVAMLISCAGTGVLLGYLSLVDVQTIVTNNVGAFWGWTLAVCATALTGFAMYLGRFLRWNSWDLLRPSRILVLAEGMLNPFDHMQVLSVTFVFGTIFVLGYLAIRILLTSQLSKEEKLETPHISRSSA